MRKRLIATLSACLLLGTLTACTPEPIVSVPSASMSTDVPALRIEPLTSPSGVNAQEGELVGHAYAAALKAAGIKAEVGTTPGSAQDAWSNLIAGSIDIVPAYSRELLSAAVPSVAPETPADVLSALQEVLPESISVLDPAKAIVGDSLVVTAETAEKYQLKTIADLTKVCNKLLLGGTADFQNSGRGLVGLGTDYNCVPKKFVVLKPLFDGSRDDVLWALLRDDIQVADIHISAPAIDDNSLVVLTDTKKLFLEQNIVPLVSNSKVSAAAQGILNKVSAALTTDELANLNRLAQDRHFANSSEAAAAWLIQVGLVKAGS